MRLHYRAKEDEATIRYVEVVGLYPWVCKYFKFPFGHPTIHLDCEDIPSMLAQKRLVLCTVLPPRALFYQVLPYRCNVLLLFCLCSSCAESEPRDLCSHETASERALTAIWAVDEVRLTVRRGYRVLKIHEFYEYEVTQYDPKTGEG
jgi:hypothetical protein